LEEKKSYPDMGSGVKQEVQAWGEAIVSGKPNTAQSPEEALKDLRLVSVARMNDCWVCMDTNLVGIA